MSSTHGTEYDRSYKRNKKIWDKVWERDSYKCYYCKFTSKKFQEIHHLNDDHEDNTMDNLVTVCPLCHQCFHLDTASATNGGKIIWLPEMSQQELNYLSRAIFIAAETARVAEEMGEKVSDFTKMASMLESSLSERSLVVEQYIQQGASDPATFANALLNMKEDKYETREEFIQPFKLLNLRTRFPVQTKYWKNTTYQEMPTKIWEKLIKDKE